MVTELSTKQFQKEVLENDLPSVVDIYTLRCPNCKVIEPIFQQQLMLIKKTILSLNWMLPKTRKQQKGIKSQEYPPYYFLDTENQQIKTGVLNQEKIKNRLVKTVSYTIEMAIKKEAKGYFKMPWNYFFLCYSNNLKTLQI